MKNPTQALAFLLIGAVASFGDTIPGTLRYMEFPTSLGNKVLKIHKALNPQTGLIEMGSNLPEVGGISDLLALEAAEEAVRRATEGALEPVLAKKVAKMGGSENVRVVVRAKTEEPSYLDKTRHSTEELIANSQSNLNPRPLQDPRAIALRFGLNVAGSRGSNMVIVQANKTVLDRMKSDPYIASIWEDFTPVPLAPELTTLGASGYTPGGIPSRAGSGVKAATFEYGLTSGHVGCLGASVNYEPWILTGNDYLKRHTQAVFKTLFGSTPSATFYHRNSEYFNGTNDVSYIVNNGIQTVSMSLDRGGTSPHRATYSEFLTMDAMAYSYPFPVFATPTANSGYAYEVNWQGYNAINVGVSQHSEDAYYEMAACTQTKNPPPRYGSCIVGSGSDCAGDREMPHLIAPGSPNAGTTFATTCLEGIGTITCGSSYSAPVVNGMAANVIAADGRLVAWPEKVRATLILTAQNVEDGDWAVSTDERDGTGTVSGSAAVAFATGHTSVSPGNTACEKGMSASSLYSSGFGSNKRFNFLVPNPKPSGKHLRVVLTWDSNPNVNNGTNALSDLDLNVQKNGGIQSSTSFDSNVEVVDIAAADLTAGSSYYIDIVPYTNRIPTNSFLYYALAWAWVVDHAPVEQ